MSEQSLRKFWVTFLPLDGVFCTLVILGFFFCIFWENGAVLEALKCLLF